MIVCTVENVEAQYVMPTVQIHCVGCDECHHDPKKFEDKCYALLWLPVRHLKTARGKDEKVNRAKATRAFMGELGI